MTIHRTKRAFLAGAGVASITPSAEHLAGAELFLAGYGGYRFRPAGGAREELFARAVVVQAPGGATGEAPGGAPGEATGSVPGEAPATVVSEGLGGATGEAQSGAQGESSGPLVWVAFDLLGLGDKTVKAIRDEAARRLGLSGAVILTSCTHTHSAPDLIGMWGGVPGAYREYVVTQAVAAIARALESLAPAELYAGQADMSHANRNRRGWNRTDPKLTVLQLRKENGAAVATLANFAAHPVIVGPENRLAASDFAGPFVRAVEADTGGVALFVQGAQGDVSPVQPDLPDDFERAARYGELLARGVPQALKAAWRVGPGIRARCHSVRAAVEAPELERAFRDGRVAPGYSVEADGEAVRVEMEVWRLSLGTGRETVEIACVPGEPTTRLGERLRAAMPGRVNLVFGLAPALYGYLIPEDEWMSAPRGAYEETMSPGRGAGELILRAVAADFCRGGASGFPAAEGFPG